MLRRFLLKNNRICGKKALQNLRISEQLYGWPEIRKFWRGINGAFWG